jgi:hypothetical protein
VDTREGYTGAANRPKCDRFRSAAPFAEPVSIGYERAPALGPRGSPNVRSPREPDRLVRFPKKSAWIALEKCNRSKESVKKKRFLQLQSNIFHNLSVKTDVVEQKIVQAGKPGGRSQNAELFELR